MRYVLLASVIAFSISPVLADTVTEYGCTVLAKGPRAEVEHILTETKVLEPTQALPKFSIMLPPGYSEAAIQCLRSDLVPAENDWKVLRAGYPLFITDRSTGNGVVIELRNGQFAVEILKGSVPTKDQLNRLQARINQLQTSMQDADFSPSPQK